VRQASWFGIVRFRRELTAEALRAQSKELLIKKYSDLCELRVSAVKQGLPALVAALLRWVRESCSHFSNG
jgi:hypothetical protein